MSTTFYRAWLPLSLAFHVVLLFTLNIMPMGARPVAGGNFYPVEIIEAATPPEVPPTVKPAPPEPSVPKESVVPDAFRQPRLENNVPPGRQSSRPDITTGDAKRAGDGTVTSQKGQGTGDTKPPAIMSSPLGTGYEAPPGDPNSYGTNSRATGVGLPGPSAGARAKFGRVGSIEDKVAGEIGDGIVKFTVQVSETGKILALTLEQLTGNPELRPRAEQQVRTNFKDYKPAMQNGKAVAGSVRVRVEFRNGKASIEEI